MMFKGDGKGYDSLVTIGMRGDGDEAMAETRPVGLLEQVVAAQQDPRGRDAPNLPPARRRFGRSTRRCRTITTTACRCLMT